MSNLHPLPVAATFSKDPKMWGVDFWPTELQQGIGAYVLDTKGNRFLDWVSALGANLLGYPDLARPGTLANRVASRIAQQAFMGVGFTLPHFLEQQVAEKIVTLLGHRVPGWRPEALGLRFMMTGTDATTMAVRLARAVTGRQWILSAGYHGWGDWSISVTPPAWGITPQMVNGIEWGDLRGLIDHIGPSVAAVIVEHPLQEPPLDYYAGVRQLCDQHGTLFILDEVVTWPRFALGGAAEVYGLTPDIGCYGKGLGNGAPISCIVGRKEYFDWFSRTDPVFASSTHSGNAQSLMAADAVLDLWDQAGVDHLYAIGQALMDGLREAGYDLIGHAPRSLLQFKSRSEKDFFIAGMRDRGILMNRPNLPNLAHALADVELTVKAAKEVKAEMATVDVEELMKGKLAMVLFSNR